MEDFRKLAAAAEHAREESGRAWREMAVKAINIVGQVRCMRDARGNVRSEGDLETLYDLLDWWEPSWVAWSDKTAEWNLAVNEWEAAASAAVLQIGRMA